MTMLPLTPFILAALALAQPLPSPPKPAGGGAAPAPEVSVTASADPKLTAVLERLERANAGLQTATADIRYIKVFNEIQGGDRHVRTGRLSFAQVLTPSLAPQLVPPAEGQSARRGFVVDLRQFLIEGGGTPELRELPRTWIFDGSWLLEKRDDGPTNKQFTKTLIVGPGNTRDPLRIGEGPLPLPIGQRPADMLAAFDLSVLKGEDELPAGTDAALRALLKECTQLKLIPHAGTKQARDFSEIRIWYREPDMLPVFAQALGTSGTKDQVLLSNLKKNDPLPVGLFDTKTPGPPWQGQVNEYRGAKDGSAAPGETPAPTPADASSPPTKPR